MTATDFRSQKKDYQTLIAEPAKAFVTAIVPLLQESISSGINGIPRTNGSIAPSNNHRRFAHDKPPYGDHVLFRLWEGPDKKPAPTIFVLMASDSVDFASGVMFADVARYRARIDTVGGGVVPATVARRESVYRDRR